MALTRKIKVVHNHGSSRETIDTDVQTWGELKKLIGDKAQGNVEAIIRGQLTSLTLDEAQLPAGDFTVFLVVKEQKSGASKKAKPAKKVVKAKVKAKAVAKAKPAKKAKPVAKKEAAKKAEKATVTEPTTKDKVMADVEAILNDAKTRIISAVSGLVFEEDLSHLKDEFITIEKSLKSSLKR